jgi:hypothetical protein
MVGQLGVGKQGSLAKSGGEIQREKRVKLFPLVEKHMVAQQFDGAMGDLGDDLEPAVAFRC